MMVHDYFLDESRNMCKDDLVIYNVGFGESFPGYTNGYDSRDYYLLEYTLRGCGHLEIDQCTYDIALNHGFLIPPQTTYRITNETKWFLCWIGFYGPHIIPYLKDARLVNGPTPVFSFENPYLFESVIEDIYYRARDHRTSNASLVGLFYSLLGMLSEYRSISFMAKEQAPLSYFEKARHFINKNIMNKPTVEQLTLEYDVSPSQLYRSFKSGCGMSPKQYIDTKKIEKACELIRHTTLSFHQIALLLGYEYDASFFQAFKRVMGVRPSEFKEAASAESSSADTALS